MGIASSVPWQLVANINNSRPSTDDLRIPETRLAVNWEADGCTMTGAPNGGGTQLRLVGNHWKEV